MALREWGRITGARSKQTRPETEIKLRKETTEILVATAEKEQQTRIGWPVKRKIS